MPAMPPRAVLSEHLEEQLKGRRLLAGVFLTFRLDPAFFEQDILPIFFDIPLSHAPAIKLVQLEDAIRDVPHGLTVYYDQNGIVPEGGASRLDVRRVSMCHPTGIFHPKNVFALVEEVEPDEEGHKARSLIVATMSANLTRAGWWENVEVCHTETISESDATRMGGDITRLLDSLERRSGAKSADGNAALKAVRTFLRDTEMRGHRTSSGRLHTHFLDGQVAVLDFMESVAGDSLRGMNLEIISPYFDDHADRLPLQAMLDRFHPKETRVFLPRNEAGEALCSDSVFECVRGLDNVSWARLPADLLRFGKAEGARSRTVHAKVYRFFRSSPKREILLVGSLNLTEPAHQRRNLETAFLVEVECPQRPDWWLLPDSSTPTRCVPRSEDEGAASSGGTRLALRFSWTTLKGEAFWDSSKPSPSLTVSWQNVPQFTVGPLPSREWIALEPSAGAELHRVLQSTSILTVSGDGKEPGFLLVQEEGMHARPSLLFDLSPAEILRYWALLTPTQRAEFLAARAPELALSEEGSSLLARGERLASEGTFFDRFAGIFLAFGCLERTVKRALPKNEREAEYRLFGQKYDSLSNLLTKVVGNAQEGKGEICEHYVTALCARQLVTILEHSYPAFFSAHRAESTALKGLVDKACALRDRVIAADPARMPEFLSWFEPWFLRRAAPVEVATQ